MTRYWLAVAMTCAGFAGCGREESSSAPSQPAVATSRPAKIVSLQAAGHAMAKAREAAKQREDVLKARLGKRADYKAARAELKTAEEQARFWETQTSEVHKKLARERLAKARKTADGMYAAAVKADTGLQFAVKAIHAAEEDLTNAKAAKVKWDKETAEVKRIAAVKAMRERQAAAEKEAARARERAQMGEVGFLRTGQNTGTLPVCPTETDHDRMRLLLSANDNEGVAEMVAAGRIWMVREGTKCRVINPGFLSSEVRILEGPYSGRSCIVTAEWAVKG